MYLVMLPGLDGTGLMFKPLLAALPAEVKPIVVKYPTGLTLGYEELLPIVMKALPKQAPFFVLGESFGGPLAIMTAATLPAHLKGLILCASFTTCPQTFVPRWASQWLPVLPFKIASFAPKRLLGEFATEEMQQALAMVKPEVMAYRLQQVVRVDVRKAFAQLTLPMLYLQSKRDRLVPASNGQQMQLLQPTLQLVRFDAGHLLLQTQPKQAADAMLAFMQRTT